MNFTTIGLSRWRAARRLFLRPDAGWLGLMRRTRRRLAIVVATSLVRAHEAALEPTRPARAACAPTHGTEFQGEVVMAREIRRLTGSQAVRQARHGTRS